MDLTPSSDLDSPFAKSCSHCGVRRNIDSFYKKKKGYLGVDSKCKQCVLRSKQKQYKKMKRAKKGIIEISVDPEESLPHQSIVLMLKYLGVQ